MSIEDLRLRIDAIDDELLALLDRRAHVAREIAQAKRTAGLPAHDPDRERSLLERVEQTLGARLGAVFPKTSVRPIFREILSACLSLEEPQTVAYLGPPGTFLDIAAQAAFGLAARYVETATIGNVIDSVARGGVTYGVAPIENSTEGGVTATLDALIDTDVLIQREFVIDVPQCLIGRQPDLASIRRVYSHPQPLAQCRQWLARHLPHADIVASSSTAAAAREAALDESAAALGSRLLAELHDLSIIRENIQDRAENATRFVVIAKSDAPATGRDKTSLAFSTAHARGALRRVLEIFDAEGLNLTRIESRPAVGRRWEYVFFADVEGHRTDPAVAQAIERLRQDCSMVRVLGSYPRSDASEPTAACAAPTPHKAGYAAPAMSLRPIARYFLRGAFVTAPLALTLYIILKILTFIDQVLPIGIPGLGLLLTLTLITLIGFLTSNVVGKSVLDVTERLLRRVPLVKLIYGSIKDLVGAFVGDRKSFDRPVAVQPYGPQGLRLLGFITREDLRSLDLPGHVAVYLPQSYNFAGFLLIAPREQVEPLDIPSAELMTFLVSGGVSGLGIGRSMLPPEPIRPSATATPQSQ